MPLIAAAFAVQATAQDKPKPAPKHMVRFSFKEGTVRHSKLVQEVSMKMNMGGAKDMDTDLKTTMWITTTVKSTKGNVAQLEQVITRVTAFADSITMKVDYDSDDPDSDPGQLETMADLIGQKIRFKLSDTGKQSAVELPKTVDRSNPSIDGMRKALLQGVTELPSTPIAIGDKWRTKDKSIPAMVSSKEMKIATETELLAVGKETITVKQQQTVEDEDNKLPGGMVAQDITISGTYKLDLRTGIPLEATVTTKTKLRGPLTVDMSVKQTIKPARTKKAKKPAAETGK